MYKVKFNTEEFVDKKRRDWERQLMNDFVIAINGMTFECKDENELYHLLSFIDGSWENTLKYGEYPFEKYRDKEKYYITLKSPKYDEHDLPLKLYGICQGYVNKYDIIEDVNNDKFVKVPFRNFYDSRQFYSEFFKHCFIEIIKK